ncbi:hypothetical protein C8R44DRAFT_973175 [Mycena epipterygia]|nr:hypothetical protein C8R44DRAFT_973175 [Mycena epipterygia]
MPAILLSLKLIGFFLGAPVRRKTTEDRHHVWAYTVKARELFKRYGHFEYDTEGEI